MNIRKQLVAIHGPFAATAMKRSIDLGKVTAKAVIAMRKELNLEIDADDYESRLQASRERMQRKFAAAFDNLTKMSEAVDANQT